MNIPRPDIVRPKPPPMDALSSSILNRLNAKQCEARAHDKKNEEKKRTAARAAAMKAQQERRAKAAAEAQSILAKSATSVRPRGRKRTSSGASSSSAGSGTHKRKRRVPDDEPEKVSSLPGMEFVARVSRAKTTAQSKTSDYSDMFGPEYLVGVDVDVVKNLAKGSAEETAKIRLEDQKKKERNAATRAKIEKLAKIEEAMRKSGELDKRKGREKLQRIREKMQSSDWVTVSEPVSAFSTIAKPPLRPLTPADKQRAKVAAAGRKAAEEARKVAVTEARKQALFARISKINGANTPPMRPKSTGRDSVRRERDDARPRKSSHSDGSDRSVSRKRERWRDEDSDEESQYESDSSDDRRSRKKKQLKRPRREYYSESEDESGDDSDSDGGQFNSSFAALEEEEMRSAALGRLEDKRERLKEAKRKREKAALKRKLGVL